MLTAETETVGGDSLDAGHDEDEELILRIPLELCVPSNITLYNLKRVVSAKLAEAKLEPRQDPMSMFLGLNGQVCADPVACPLRMLVPGSVVSLVADLPEAHQVSRLGLCLNAFQLMQVQWSGFPASRPTGSMVSPQKALSLSSLPRKLLPDDVMAKRRQELYKTQLCTNFTGPSGYCSFGERCHFAHGKAELRVYGKPEVNADAHAPHKDEEDSNASKDAQWNSKDTEWKSNSTEWNWSDKPNGRNWETWDSDNDKWKYDNSDWKWNDWSTWDRESGWSDWRSDWSEWRSEPEAIRRSSSRRSRSPEASGLVLRAVRRSRSRRSRRRPRRDEGNERGREMRRRRSRSRGSGRRWWTLVLKLLWDVWEGHWVRDS